MTWRVAPALVRLRGQLDDTFPDREKPDGTIGDQAHAARESDHNPDDDHLVCAVDLKRLNARLSNLEVARALVASRDPRIKYVIADGRMWSSYPARGYAAWAERPYTGASSHPEHAHLSVTQEGKRSTASWAAVALLAGVKAQTTVPPQPLPEEDDMTPAQAKQLDEAVAGIARLEAALAALVRPRAADKHDHDPKAIDLGDVLTKTENETR